MTNNSLPVALVTGGAARIGASIVRSLHAQGINIAIHYHQSAGLAKQLAQELNQKRSNSACLVTFNLNDIHLFEDKIAEVLATWGRLDILINNASGFYQTDIGKVTTSQWDDLMGSNLKGAFFLAQSVGAQLKKNNGCIINIADIHGERPLKHYAVYCIAKSGLIMMTKSLARELGPAVRVNAIAPGAIIWPVEHNELDAKARAEIEKRTALKRAGSPEDISNGVIYLVKHAPYVTGEILHVDGGRLLTT